MLNDQTFLDQLSQLVELPTVSDDREANSQALDYIESLLNDQVVVERLNREGVEMLVASTEDTRTPEFGYLVHVDVVAAKADQFAVTRDGDRLMGRGVSDMKFSIPLGVALLNEVAANGKSPSFSVVITTDEEVGGFKGAAVLAQEIEWRPEVLIVPDGGDNFVFVNKAKGVCQLEISTTGSPAHSSRPWKGDNALERMSAIMGALLDAYGEQSKQETWERTMNLGQLHAGRSTNQVCDRAVLNVDFRYPETDSIEAIQREVEELVAAIDPRATVTRGSTGLPTFTDPELPVVTEFMTALQTEIDAEMSVKGAYGASDCRHFAEYGIPVLMTKPVGGDIHMDSEWISLSSTMQYYQGLRRFLGLQQ